VPDTSARRILVVTDHLVPTAEVTDAIRRRTRVDDVQFRLVVLNPARAEVHLLHPERHDQAAEAERVLRDVVAALERSAGAHVIGSVSVRHDPMDAIEETLFSEPVDEIMIAVPAHRLARLMHQELEHRLAHFGLPISVVRDEPVASPARRRPLIGLQQGRGIRMCPVSL
jgi:hypothetical protein